MTCNCGKTDKSCPKKFPSAVVEINNPEQIVLLRKVVIPASLGDDTEVPPVVGKYRNVVLQYEANDHIYLYSSDGIPTEVRVPRDILKRIADLELADQIIEQEIEDLRNNPDVVDIVATYADLLEYDTSKLGDKDVIRVLTDETHDDESSYYRWDKPNQEWVFIGAVEGYYTKDQTDALLEEKQDVLTAGDNISIVDDTISAVDTTYTAGTNITIDANNQISATDTTYTAGNGLSLSGTEFSVDNSVVAFQTDLPTVNDATLTIQKNSTDVGTFTANASSNSTINITVPTTAADVSALPDSTKYGASISLTIDSSTYVVTAQLKDQDGNNIGSAQTIDLPLESVVVSGSYDSQTKEVVLTLQGGSTIRFSVADLVSGLQETLVAGANIQIAADGKTISATDTTYSAFTGATSQDAGAAGLVPAPAAGDDTKFLSGNGLWTTVSQYSLPIASANTLGGVKIGQNLTIDPATGVLDSQGTTYTAGTNIQISNQNVISATDTTYSAFTGTDGQTAGTSGLVPAPATTDAGKFLKADGTWGTVQAGGDAISAADWAALWADTIQNMNGVGV